MINKFIQKRLKVDDSKCIYNITDFGNTSSTSIPLMIISKLREKFNGKKIVCSAFGTGLAWGTMVMDTSTDGVFPELIRYLTLFTIPIHSCFTRRIVVNAGLLMREMRIK